MQALQRLSTCLMAFGLALAWSTSARSAPPETAPAAVIDEKSACLAQHESAQLFSQAGRLRDARNALHACARQTCPEYVRADCVKWLEGISERLPSVVLVARSPHGDEIDVRVSVDGELVTERLDGKAMELNPGAHQFRFEHPAYEPVEQQLLVIEGEKNRRVLVTLVTERQRLPVRRPVPTVVYGLAAITAVALGSSVYFGLSGIRERQALTRNCAPFCSRADLDGVRTKLIAADISLVVAVISGGAALWAALSRAPVSSAVTQSGSREALSVDFAPSGTGAGLIVRGEF